MSSSAANSASHRQIWIDGELVPWDQATVHVLSHSLQRGSLIFDYMSVHEADGGTAVFRLDEHVGRLLHSAELVGLPLELDAAAIRSAICATVRANPGAKAVKVSAYLPSIEVDVVPLDPRVTVAIAAYDPQADINAGKPQAPHRPETLSIWIEKAVKNRREDIVPPQAKVSANYTSPMQAKWNARKAGYDEILLVDEAGHVAEGPTTNVFLVDAAGTLATPTEEKVLLGVTRRSILELAVDEGLNVEERGIRPEELANAEEAFLTGTTAGVWPIAKIDDKPLGAAVPGPVSQRLRERFRAATRGADPAFAHWLTYVDTERAGRG
ncbi:MAG: aminotransferase class IV [Myxococcota bacterium]